MDGNFLSLCARDCMAASDLNWEGRSLKEVRGRVLGEGVWGGVGKPHRK